MNRLTRHCDADLTVAAALALVALCVAVLPFPDPIRAVVFLPVTLLVPGYLLSAAIFVPGAISRVERVVYSCAFSVCFWAIGGLIVQLAIDLDRGVWLAMLMLLALGTVPIAQVRRRGRRPLPWRPRFGPRALIPIGLATAIAASAIALASTSADSQFERARFSSVWIVPADSSAGAVQVGVENREGTAIKYRLRVSQAGVRLSGWTFSLDDDHVRRRILNVPTTASRAPLVVALFRNGVLYRRAALDPELIR